MLESRKRSQITILPRLSAGSITELTCSAREAAYRSASHSADMPVESRLKSTSRILSEIGQPPGSRDSTTSQPRRSSHSFNSLICVDLPHPSEPSSEMNRPRGICPSSSHSASDRASSNT